MRVLKQYWNLDFPFKGWISDRVFGSRRGPPIILFLVGSFVSFGFTMIASENKENYVLDCFLLLANGYCIYGPQVLVRKFNCLFASAAAASSPLFTLLFSASFYLPLFLSLALVFVLFLLLNIKIFLHPHRLVWWRQILLVEVLHQLQLALLAFLPR